MANLLCHGVEGASQLAGISQCIDSHTSCSPICFHLCLTYTGVIWHFPVLLKVIDVPYEGILGTDFLAGLE